MLVIHIVLIMLMTENTLKLFKICRYQVTIGAGIPLIIVCTGINRKILTVVIPGGLVPSRRIMAVFTGNRESGTDMAGIICRVVFILMAGIAVCRKACILPILMTIGTGCYPMRTCQRKIRIFMVKSSRGPGDIAVTLAAVVIELPLHMIGIGHTKVIVLMTGPAVSGRSGKLTINVTGTAYN